MSIVRIHNGVLRGRAELGVHAFKGIPYAEPIAGRAKWMAPQPRRDWSGEHDAQHYGLICPQFSSRGWLGPFATARRRYFEAIRVNSRIVAGEDCLLLNVWTPTLEPSSRLPVMVYIHGGSMTAGAANELYDGTGFARKNVVLVTIQYRLGPLGFLHGAGLFNDRFCADNRGFLDQIAALQWVKDNIAAFGGDAACVTVFGESAGATSVYQLIASPLAKGLFRRAIAMGGNPANAAPAEDHYRLAADVLADVGIAAGDEQALISLSPARIADMQTAMRKRLLDKAVGARYGSLSRDISGFMGPASATDFLPGPVLERYRTGTPNDIDLMLGTCAADGELFSLVLPLSKTLSAKLSMKMLAGAMPGGDTDSAIRFYRRQMPTLNSAQLFGQINNDAFFRMPTIAAAQAHAIGHPGRTYLFQVDYQSAIKGLSAVHGIDVALLFNGYTSAQALVGRDAETLKLTSTMLDAWTAFAKMGSPSTREMPRWESYESKQRTTMVFDRVSRAVPDYGGELRTYWQDVATIADEHGP